MKKILIAGIVTFGFISISHPFNKKILWRGELMSLNKVCKRWGDNPHNLERFKSAKNNLPIRSSMACSIIKNQKKFVGKDIGEVRKLFGTPTGHYFSDMYPAYIIESGKTRDEDTWQLLFFLDRNKNISEIVVHKNCCDDQ